MADQLMFSKDAKGRRKGTTFKELQFLFVENLTTKLICENVYSRRFDEESIAVKEILENKDFDIVGVTDENEKILGYAQTIKLQSGLVGDFTEQIDLRLVISESTPISQLVHVFTDRSYAFVIGSKDIRIVTKSDLNKPIARIYLFGIISLLEMHLNRWIQKEYENDEWKDLLKQSNIYSLEKSFNKKKKQKESLTILESLLLSEKKIILGKTNSFLIPFGITEESFITFMSNVEILRNEIAHSHNSIISTLPWNDFIHTVYYIESFLIKSEELM